MGGAGTGGDPQRGDGGGPNEGNAGDPGASGAASVCECEFDRDCDTLTCVEGLCEAASCFDGVKNGSESDVDCGGGACEPCAQGGACVSNADCPEMAHCVCARCQPLPHGDDSSCQDGFQNGQETDVDCGGPDCPSCSDQRCCAASDCTSNLCVDGVCVEPTCDDEILNGDETDLDCGGSCPPCEPGSRCNGDSDCVGEACVLHGEANPGCREIRTCAYLL